MVDKGRNPMRSDDTVAGRHDAVTVPQASLPHGPALLSRRAFIGGALVTAALASLVPTQLSGCGSSSTSIPVLSPDASAVKTLGSTFTQSDQASHATQDAHFSLTAGTLLWAGTSVAATLVPGSTSSPFTTAGVTSLDTGVYSELLKQAVGASEGYTIYDVRCSDSIFVWTELIFLTGDWRVYSATWSGTTLGTPRLLDNNDDDYDPAFIAASSSRAIWVVEPSTSGTKTLEKTYVKSQGLSDSDAVVICTSYGRLATPPRLADGVLTITPRLENSSVYYQLLACDPATGAEVSSAVLPKTVKPYDALWLGSGFSFSIESTYTSSGTIGTRGVYVQRGDEYLYVGKTPLDDSVLISDQFVCKTAYSVTVIDFDTQEYYSITPPSGAADYGDCIGTEGMADRLVLYTTVSSNSGSSTASADVRVFRLA